MSSDTHPLKTRRRAVWLPACAAVAMLIGAAATLGQTIVPTPGGPLLGDAPPPVHYLPPKCQPSGPQIGGMHQQLPVVPYQQTRPSEGDAPDQKWGVRRTEEESEPVASFIDSLRGNDAALEVVIGQGRLLTLKKDIAGTQGAGVIAVGDPTIVEFQVLPNPRMIRLIGKRAGVTDLSITTADGQTYSFEVHVVYDLELLQAELKQVFPDAFLRLAQLREHVIVEGEARSPRQVTLIVATIEAFLESVQVPAGGGGGGAAGGPAQFQQPQGRTWGQERRTEERAEEPSTRDEASVAEEPEAQAGPYGQAAPETGGAAVSGGYGRPRIINLIRLPGVHQVSLQVRVAELDRTGLREIGADILGVDPDTGNILGTQIGGATVTALGTLGLGGLVGEATGDASQSTTAFGIFPSGDFEILLRALRRNALVRVLAEPNLMAMSGHQASFLAGGQFPVPVPQTGAGGFGGQVTIEWKDFGVQLNFVPYVLDDETIRLYVQPEVSSIDEALGVQILGTAVPGVVTRKVDTTVELRQGQTLALAGLLQVELDARTSRIPLLGDLPYIGPLFSNTSHNRVEKELLVLVTPYLVSPMNPEEVPCLPGDEIQDPNNLEFYLMNRIEGRTGSDFRSTVRWDNPLGLVELMRLESRCVSGPVGFSK